MKVKNWKLMMKTFCQMHSHISRIQVLIFISHYKCVTEGNYWYWWSLLTVLHNSIWTNIWGRWNSPLFEGDAAKLPIFNAHTAVSEMVAIGKIMAHSIVQLGIRPGFFPTAAYMYIMYICSRDFSTAIPFINVDTTTSRTKCFLNKVSWL